MMRRVSIDHNDSGYQEDNNEETESQILVGDRSMEELSETNTEVWWSDPENITMARTILNIEERQEVNCQIDSLIYLERRPQRVTFQYSDIIYQLEDPSLERLEDILADVRKEINQSWRRMLQSVGEIRIYIYI